MLLGSTVYVLVGSSSLLLTTSGVSSEDVALTAGQYGSVVTSPSGDPIASLRPEGQSLVDLSVYRFTLLRGWPPSWP
jgi:hypothetical protein